MKFLKTISAIIVNIIFRIPFLILESFFIAVSEFFRLIADGFYRVQMALKPIVMLPYVKDWNRQLADEKQSNRLRQLKILNQKTDE